MNTIFLLMAQYDAAAIIPIDKVCADYFSPLTPETLKRKIASGEIDLPLIRLGNTQKSARGVHLCDLASYIDEQRAKARREHEKLMKHR